jgi:hypothetical protein
VKWEPNKSKLITLRKFVLQTAEISARISTRGSQHSACFNIRRYIGYDMDVYTTPTCSKCAVRRDLPIDVFERRGSVTSK